MSWIAEVDEAAAEGEIAELYAELREQRGKVSNILKVHSLRPQALKHHLDLYMGLMFGAGGLSRRQRELLAVAVSQANDCAYCVAHHVEALGRYVRDEPQLAALGHDAALRDVGLADEDILLTNLVVAYFNFVNRIALGLGVEHGADEVSGYKV